MEELTLDDIKFEATAGSYWGEYTEDGRKVYDVYVEGPSGEEYFTFEDEDTAYVFIDTVTNSTSIDTWTDINNFYDSLINKFNESASLDNKILIEVDAETSLSEGLPSGNIEDKYDDQTLEEWYDFASNIEMYIENNFIIKNINLIKNPESLSEYIDFYKKDSNGNKKSGMIDLRLSDHKQTANARKIRKKKVNNLDLNSKLISITVNNRSFTSYDEALEYAKQLIAKTN